MSDQPYTQRQRLYKQYRLEGFSKYASAIKAGYSKSMAIKSAKSIDNSVGIKGWLEIIGITDKYLADYVQQGLNATKLHACDVWVKNDETGKWVINENSNDFVEVPDWMARHKFLETLLKLNGKLKDNGNGNGAAPTIQLVVVLEKESSGANPASAVPADLTAISRVSLTN